MTLWKSYLIKTNGKNKKKPNQSIYQNSADNTNLGPIFARPQEFDLVIG